MSQFTLVSLKSDLRRVTVKGLAEAGMLVTFVLSVIVLMYCAAPIPERDFEKYTSHFCLVAEINGVLVDCDSISIKYVGSSKMNEAQKILGLSYPQGLAGYCDPFSQTVYVNQDMWDISSDVRRQELIDHELGHCLLGRAHVETASLNCPAVPTSIMSPILIDQGTFETHVDYYETELFTNTHEFGSLGRAIKNSPAEMEKLRVTASMLEAGD
jgi:hypothetical protein